MKRNSKYIVIYTDIHTRSHQLPQEPVQSQESIHQDGITTHTYMKRNDIWQLRPYCNNETRLSVAKEVLVSDFFFQNLLQAGGRKVLTIVIKLIQESHKHDKRHYKLLYRANNVVRIIYTRQHTCHTVNWDIRFWNEIFENTYYWKYFQKFCNMSL